MIDNGLKEDIQLESMNKLLESYEDEENNAQQYRDFIDSLDHDSLYNLDNAMDALEINSERINTLEEVKTELMDQENCDHDWYKEEVTIILNVLSAFIILVKKIDLLVGTLQGNIS